MKWILVILLIGAPEYLGQRIPPPPQSFINNLNNPPQTPQNVSSGGPGGGVNLQLLQQQQLQQQQQKSEELANIKDENIKKILTELSTLQTPSQMSDTMQKVTDMVAPLFIADYESRKDQISSQGRDSTDFPQRLISAVTDIQGEETKALVLQRKLDTLHASDFAFLPLAIQYGLQDQVLGDLSGTKLAGVTKVNPGDTVIAFKVATALVNKPEEQIEYLQSIGFKLLPQVQRIIMGRLLEWWGDPHTWKDRQLNLLTSAGTPLLAYMPNSQLQSLDDELADRFVTILGQTQDIARGWWRKPMSLKKAWFDVAKGARYFGAVHEWSFRRMQKLSFLLEGASPEDLQMIPQVQEIKGLVIGNHYTELQARVVFDAFYNTLPLSQEDLQEFQFHVLDLIPTQLQRFDFADSFATLDEMMSILDRQPDVSYPTVLQISYFMWPIINGTDSVMNIAPPATWQKRELAQIGKMFFLLPKSVLIQMPQGIVNWDSNTLASIRSTHLTQFQIWKLTGEILQTVDERFKPDYIFMIPPPYQKGIPSQNISQALLGSTNPRPEVLRALIEQATNMLISQKAVILQRISNRIGESNIIRTMVSAKNPAELFQLISPKVLSKNMGSIIKSIMEMPETGRFGITSIQTKLLPQDLLALWLKWVRENGQVARWTAEDLLGRSPMGGTHELNLAILGLTCRDIDIVDPWDILSIIMHYRHELYALRRFKPALAFNVNLRSCVLEKFVDYLKQKRFLGGNQTDAQVLTAINVGETEAVGGEILSAIPTAVLEQLDVETRISVVKEIGQLQMLELFTLSNLNNLQWYGRTLFRDLAVSSSHGLDNSSQRRKRQEPSTDAAPAAAAAADNTANTGANSTNPSDTAKVSELDSRSTTNDTGAALDPSVPAAGNANGTSADAAAAAAVPSPILKHGIDMESLNGMGNLICFADNLFDANWPRSLLKDVLEAKTSVGEKTCCLPKHVRDKWFDTLKAVYGADTSSWNEFDITSIGDLLIVLPEQDLQKISTDSLGKASTPLMRQSAWATKISIPGQIKNVQFVTACAEALGTEGQEFMAKYKTLMKRLFQASQWMINTVKTTQELIRDGVGRTGRIPRWAEHTLVKRQIQISMDGGQLSYGGTTAATPMMTPATTMFASPSTFGMQHPGNMGFVSYAPQYSPMMTMPQQSMFASTTPTMYTTPTGQVFYSQPMMMPAQQQPVMTFGTPITSGVGAATSTGTTGAVAGAGTVAGGGSTSGAAGAAAGSAATGGSFSSAGAATQAGGSSGSGFAQGGSFAQGADTTGAGSFSQANANTFASRSTGTGQQPQQQSAPQSNPQTQGANVPTGQSQSQAQTGPQVSAPPSPPQTSLPPPAGPPPVVPPPQPGAAPVQQQSGPLQGQPQPGAPLSQPQPGAPQGQPQPGAPQGQPQSGAPQGQPGTPPGQPQPGSPPLQTGAHPGQQQPGTSPGKVPSQGATVFPQQPGSKGSASTSSADIQDLRTRALNFGGALQDDTHTAEITCHGIKSSGAAAIGLSIDDLNKLSQADLFDCVEALGRIEWDDDIKGQIMSLLKQKLEFNKDSINALTLIELGDLITAFSAKDDGQSSNTTSNATIHSDISMIDLTLPNSLDMLAILGTQINDPALLKSLAEKFNQDNKIFPGFSEGIARPENLRIVVMALGNIICGFKDKIVNSIFETDASLFIDTSRVLGQLEGCGSEVLSTLAAHAVRPSNYGPPRLWTQEDLETIGVVFAGLKPDLISTIPSDAMQGLTSLAVKNLPASSITAFTSDQLSKMSFSAAMAFSHVQSNNFSPSEAEAIKAVLQVKSELFNVPTSDVPLVEIVIPEQPNDSFVVRGAEDSAEPDPGLAGRAREATITPPVTEPPTTEAPTTTPPTTEAPKSSASASKVPSTHINIFVTVFAVILSVIRCVKI